MCSCLDVIISCAISSDWLPEVDILKGLLRPCGRLTEPYFFEKTDRAGKCKKDLHQFHIL